MCIIICFQDIVRLLKHMEESAGLLMDKGRVDVCKVFNQDIIHGCNVAKKLTIENIDIQEIRKSALISLTRCLLSMVSIHDKYLDPFI